ncbi:amidohydrolase family protein [Streptomyces sp. P1-3]|uniref:amidohydrolase family protein n=1 Tax=Streptomyces sp. P1-3 TaxID=3421658 RepID=UPI003D36DDAE
MPPLSRRFGVPASVVVAAAVVASPGGAGAAVAEEACFDRTRQPYTSVVDSHLHFRPFGGEAISFDEVNAYLRRSGVRYANVFGIGQKLPADSDCTYYLDCPGTPVLPSVKNDIVNGESYVGTRPQNPRLTLAMTSFDLARPETVPQQIALYDKEFPGLFRWAGEVNLIKGAILPNGHEPATLADIKGWAPFMRELERRGIPITIHSDLGTDAEPTKYLPLIREVLNRYPRNKIVWAHMGLSKELSAMDPAEHIAIVKQLLDRHPNLTLDLSWRVLEDRYFSRPGVRQQYAALFDAYPTRAIPGTDFVASRDKGYAVYKEELEVTSRINKALGDEAFRGIALGQNYFRLLGLKTEAPQVCKRR